MPLLTISLCSSLSQYALGQQAARWVSVKAGCGQTFTMGAEQMKYAHFTFVYRRSSVLFFLVTQLTNWWNFGKVVENGMIKILRDDNERVQMPSLGSHNTQEYDITYRFCSSCLWDANIWGPWIPLASNMDVNIQCDSSTFLLTTHSSISVHPEKPLWKSGMEAFEFGIFLCSHVSMKQSTLHSTHHLESITII